MVRGRKRVCGVGIEGRHRGEDRQEVDEGRDIEPTQQKRERMEALATFAMDARHAYRQNSPLGLSSSSNSSIKQLLANAGAKRP
nr:hypothetical protein CFP56_12055 [Quercus suber]